MKTKQENQDFTSKKAYWGGGGGLLGYFLSEPASKISIIQRKRKGKNGYARRGGGGENQRVTVVLPLPTWSKPSTNLLLADLVL